MNTMQKNHQFSLKISKDLDEIEKIALKTKT